MPTPSPENLAEFHAVITLPVQWGEQDMFGHVNNAVYFRWFESARIAYLDQIGLSYFMEAPRIGPILAAIGCNYRRQLTFPDTVEIGSRITRIGRSSLTMTHGLWSQQQQAIIADGDSAIVVFNYDTQRSVPVPDEVRAAIEKIEGHAL
jgi:acyl-CoA thioester hydrolase